jgi:hypothetical protein
MAYVVGSWRPVVSLLVVFWAAPCSSGQGERVFPDFHAEPGWIDQLTKGGLQDWTTDGEEKGDSAGWMLGGKGPARMTLNLPLADEFKVWLEFKFNGAGVDRPVVEVSMPGRTSTPPLPFNTAGEWMNVVLICQRGPGGRGHVLTAHYALEHSPRGNVILSSGGDRLDSIGFSIPAGATMTLRRVRFQNSPHSAGPDRSDLVMPLLLLGGALIAVMAAGWWLNRRPRQLGERGARTR